jgi:DNA repair exonuclease SbcCD nuclease subunit
MDVVVTTDWHGDASTAGFARFDDVEAAVGRSVEHAVEIKAGLYLFMGDLITNDPSLDLMIRCAALAQNTAARLSTWNIPSVWMPGNHDVFEDGRGTTVVDVLNHCLGVAYVMKEPGTFCLEGNKLALVLPYAPPSHAYDPASFVEETAAKLEAQGRNLDDVVLVAGHLMIEGIGKGSESEDMARGGDIWFPNAQVKKLFPRAVRTNGHYHRRQVFDGIHIPGSLAGPMTRGEQDNEAGFMVIRV